MLKSICNRANRILIIAGFVTECKPQDYGEIAWLFQRNMAFGNRSKEIIRKALPNSEGLRSIIGGEGGNRTLTVSLPPDFESGASASSTTSPRLPDYTGTNNINRITGALSIITKKFVATTFSTEKTTETEGVKRSGDFPPLRRFGSDRLGWYMTVGWLRAGVRFRCGVGENPKVLNFAGGGFLLSPRSWFIL